MTSIVKKLIEKLVAILKGQSQEKSKLEQKYQEPKDLLQKEGPPKDRSASKGMLYVKNDSPRLKNELTALQTKNKELYALIIDLYKWIAKEFGKDTIITMIYRTQEEQDSIYKDTRRGNRLYNEKPWKSPHQTWTAVDLRTFIYTEEEIEKIAKYLNDKYNSSNYYKTTAMYHEVTTAQGKKLGKHFHINYAKK